MKKFLVLIMAILLVFTFAGCGGGGGSDDDDDDTDNGGNGETAATPWLCFKAAGGDVDVKIKLVSTVGTMSSVPSLEYSTDGSTWSAIVLSNPADGATTDNPVATLTDGSKMYIRAVSTNAFLTEYVVPTTMVAAKFDFSGTGNIEASGNIMSLVDKTCASTTIPSDGCFMQLFNDCTKLLTPPELPATTLKIACYSGMFDGCSSLTAAPDLPATTLVMGCYVSMFEGCSSLTEGPELKAASLINPCCIDMFRNCSALTSLKVNFDTWVDGAAENWVNGVAATGTFTCPSALPATYDNDHIPAGWTKTDL